MQLSPESIAVRLLVAASCGAVIGLEREYRRKSAGLKTLTLIAIASGLFTIVSVQMGGEPSRIAAQVVTGVGFLGAGAIMHSRLSIHGLTTAAVIFVVAGVGVSAGAGELALAGGGSALTLLVLGVVRQVEHVVGKRGDAVGYSFLTSQPVALVDALTGILRPRRLRPEDLAIERLGDGVCRVSFTVAADDATSHCVFHDLMALDPAVARADAASADSQSGADGRA